jgi:hypothetical protein
MAYCFSKDSFKNLAGANKTVQFAFYSQSNKYGYKSLQYEQMVAG